MPLTEQDRKPWENLIQKVLNRIPRLIKERGKQRAFLEVDGLTDDVWKGMQKKVVKIIEDEYVKQYKGVSVKLGSPDKLALEIVKRDYIREASFIKLKKDLKRKAMRTIAKGIRKNLTIPQMTKLLQKELGVIESRAELIARNETHHITNTARERAYTTLGKVARREMLFRWIGPMDFRTTTYCRTIHRRTNRGVKLDRLKQIISEEADPKWYNPQRPFSPHANCRHILLRCVTCERKRRER